MKFLLKGDALKSNAFKRFIQKLIGFSLLAVTLFSCEKPQDILNDLNGLFGKEATHFVDLQKYDSSQEDFHGEVSVNTLNQWSQTLGVIANRLRDLDTKLEKYKNDRSKIQASLDVLKGLLTSLLDREATLVILSPSWKIREAKLDQQNVANSLALIRTFTLKQFGAVVGDQNSLVVTVSVDEKLQDTLPECLEQVGLAFNQYRDSRCQKHFQEVCTHQTLLSCVDSKLKDFRLGGHDCVKEVLVKPEGNSTEAVRESVCRSIKDFLTQRDCLNTLNNADYYDPKMPGFCASFKAERNKLSCVIESRNKVYRKAEIDQCAPTLVADENARFQCLGRMGSIYETRIDLQITRIAEQTRDGVTKACMSRDPILRR
ncbi:MAG: hypothetical protein KA116_01585 [Proteobacteria bacterium]|nr:hypothetical protein [Pseudomonadota bacterium]